MSRFRRRGLDGLERARARDFLAVRATTGKLRELFLSILLGLVATRRRLCHWSPFGGRIGNQIYCFSALARHVPIGLAAGCALVYFGKIRPKAR